MKLSDITNLILDRIKQNGLQAKIVSIEHLSDLQQEIEAHRLNGLLDEELYQSYLNRFDFNRSAYFKEALSLIVVTAPQPQRRVTFNWQDQTYFCIIPPTYDPATDSQIKNSLTDILKPHGYHLEKKRLPEKLLSVRSGLARYGQLPSAGRICHGFALRRRQLGRIKTLKSLRRMHCLHGGLPNGRDCF